MAPNLGEEDVDLTSTTPPAIEDDDDASDEARVLVLYTGGTIGMALKGLHLGAQTHTHTQLASF